jgi:hypothetical protein
MSQDQYAAKKLKRSDKEVKLVGKWKAVLTRGAETVCEQEGYNVITTNGTELLAAYLASAALSATRNPFRFIAIGTDSTAEVASDTALGAESTRTTGTATYTSNSIFSVKGTFASGDGTGAIVEYGLFSANSGGTMLSRDTESVVNKGANDVLTVTAQITVS